MNGYIDPADFGLDGPWCPKVHGQEELGCQEPTFKQLLQMTSGLLPSDNLGCGTPNSTWTPSDWFWPYRQDSKHYNTCHCNATALCYGAACIADFLEETEDCC